MLFQIVCIVIPLGLLTTARFSTSCEPLFQRFREALCMSSRNGRFLLLLEWLFVVSCLGGTYKLFVGSQLSEAMPPNTECLRQATQDTCDAKDLCCTPQQHANLLMLMLDSQATDVSGDLLSLLSPHAVWFRVLNEGPKISNSVYTSYYTGKAGGNADGTPIKSDNMWAQLYAAHNNTPARYFGSASEARLIPPETNWVTNVDLYDDTQYMFEHLLPDHATQEQVHKTLDTCSLDGTANVYWQSLMLDGINHEFGRHSEEARHVLKIELEHIRHIKAWVDKQGGDYVLMLCSDHGGRDINQISLEMHGSSRGGNEPFVLLYHPSLNRTATNHTRGGWIDMVDVAATVVQFLSGASIPAESVGVAAPANPDDLVSVLKLRIQNIHQLQRLARFSGLRPASIDLTQMLDMAANPQNYTHHDIAHAVELATSAALKNKALLLGFHVLPRFHVFAVCLGVSVALFVVLFLDFPSTRSIFNHMRTFPGGCVLILAFAVGIVVQFPFFHASQCTSAILILFLAQLVISTQVQPKPWKLMVYEPSHAPGQ